MDKQQSGDLCESLCCLMDGELEPEQTQFLLRRLGHDQPLRDRWERYHRVRSVIQDHHSGSLNIPLDGFAARVSAALADEASPAEISPVAATGPTGVRRWLQPLAGVAVAASVAVVTFNAWQPDLSGPAVTPVQGLLSQTIDDPTGEFEGRVAAPPSTVGQQAAAGAGNQTLQRYLIRHTQVSAAGHRLPLVYVVSDSSTRANLQDDAEVDDSAADPKLESARP